ncbi:DUF4249 family protein [Fluviicola taffensis]|uniref:Lipoprotein n=1 Tax=Fluviicola taffensis (strain DSM 16823 / NCIMB 13979 / RW262) TaxID=755732 RepID=F2IG77_FLUTR|nr:DUF4249 family protein [Fluviicola taffensis]AEA44712.1 hypothetical protein Fluta_2731 [Fluviicola taffensis DSM 16823]
MRFLQFSLYSFILGSLLFLTSCKEDFDFSGDHVETPVLFGLLDRNDSLHYVKLTRTFSGSNNALDVALIEDSSYFADAVITIEEWLPNPATNVSTKYRTWTLQETILNTKAPGAFYSPHQKVYFFKTEAFNNANAPAVTEQNLTKALKDNANAIYKLKASINGGDIVVNAETKLVNGLSITTPSANGGNYKFRKTVSGTEEYTSTTVTAANGNAKVVDARLEFSFKEYFNGDSVQKSFMWKIGEFIGDQIQGSNSSFIINGESFYNLVRQNCTSDATINKRKFTSLKLYITGGSDELSKYILVNKPSSSLAQNKPSFTNLTRTDGGPVIGLFSSRLTVKQEKVSYNPAVPAYRALDKLSTRELCIGAITGSFSFCSDHITDNVESWYCQ